MKSRQIESGLASLLEEWQSADDLRAILPADHAAIRAAEVPRALVIELLSRRESNARDLYNACARLGRSLADAGASPSLAATTLDGAVSALRRASIDLDSAEAAAARASLIEGYVAAILDAERSAQKKVWEYPACSVRLDEKTLAIVAAYPDDDLESLANWAARVALGAHRDGVERVIVGGSKAVQSELAHTLGLIGITVADRLPARGWLRIPFWKIPRS
ncbi:MAG: hypothetical protein FWD69_14315 [Polyangiaceae bacterium]|nr:hypothetical protein [Polyangiaceae bacterium]